MGPSGSGKSTLLHMLGGLDARTSGEIWLDGKRADTLSESAWALLRRKKIGFVFQFFNLVANMTVADNVELPALLAGASAREARERREHLLGELGLTDRADAAPAQLSGGEQQRVALARALANEPSLLLADEPTGNLDSRNTRDVLRLLGEVHQRRPDDHHGHPRRPGGRPGRPGGRPVRRRDRRRRPDRPPPPRDGRRGRSS